MSFSRTRFILRPRLQTSESVIETRQAVSFPGSLHLIESDDQLVAAMPLMSAAMQMGFDTETRPSFKKGEVHKVALLQLSTETDAFVVRLFAVKNYAPLKEIFENPQILKVGVAIRDDLKALQIRFKFEPKNFVELQDVAKKIGLHNFGLKGMTEEVLGASLSKGAKLTNWENPHLTEAQLKYAATDAWVGLKIYQRLMQGFTPAPKVIPSETKPES